MDPARTSSDQARRWVYGVVWLGLFAGTANCGNSAYRALNVDVQGLSGRAEILEVLVLDGQRGPNCSEIRLDNVLDRAGAQASGAVQSRRWTRGSGAPRLLAFEPVEVSYVVVVAYTLDEAGQPLQIACVGVDYSELESPEVTLHLSPAIADIVSPWRTYLGLSSLSSFSDEAGWLRPMLRGASMIRAIARWS
ncbi:MAG: hypothetical protein IPK13_22925 [Deltaproteobacteria bacterium]|nr:hypothetical protein [Deltaproteobacteria bacterium]